ncbi:hypothetical protein E4U59_005809 [Claviceps monticola]|nr:hypothetical protein E4U59_005809 [Claviceps monticola]
MIHMPNCQLNMVSSKFTRIHCDETERATIKCGSLAANQQQFVHTCHHSCRVDLHSTRVELRRAICGARILRMTAPGQDQVYADENADENADVSLYMSTTIHLLSIA